MTSVTRARARSALVNGVAPLLIAGLVAGLAGCDSGDDIGESGEGGDGSPSSSHGADAPGVKTVTTIQHGEGLDPAGQARAIEHVTAAIDPWFDEAFLGTFPRSDFSSAFTTFTEGAAADAQRDLALLSNAGLADQIDSATATNRRVRLDVFAPDGRPRGVTANFVLDFDTTGDVEQHLRVHGSLFLTRVKHTWKVFGYDVDQAAQL
jgi:hypothetical protein